MIEGTISIHMTDQTPVGLGPKTKLDLLSFTFNALLHNLLSKKVLKIRIQYGMCYKIVYT